MITLLTRLCRDFQADCFDGFVSNDAAYIELWVENHRDEIIFLLYDICEDTESGSDWTIRECFEGLRKDGQLGDILLTVAVQEEICELVDKFYIKK
jgi:hypothetical protein